MRRGQPGCRRARGPRGAQPMHLTTREVMRSARRHGGCWLHPQPPCLRILFVPSSRHIRQDVLPALWFSTDKGTRPVQRDVADGCCFADRNSGGDPARAVVPGRCSFFIYHAGSDADGHAARPLLALPATDVPRELLFRGHGMCGEFVRRRCFARPFIVAPTLMVSVTCWCRLFPVCVLCRRVVFHGSTFSVRASSDGDVFSSCPCELTCLSSLFRDRCMFSLCLPPGFILSQCSPSSQGFMTASFISSCLPSNYRLQSIL